MTADIKVYEGSKQKHLKVHSHWIHNTLVILEVGSEKEIVVVSAEDLKRAIDNCTNTGL